MKYTVTFTERAVYECEVEASCHNEALNKVRSAIENGARDSLNEEFQFADALDVCCVVEA